MTCKHCCGADQIFDFKSAKKELKKYQRKGARKSTKALLQAMSTYRFQSKSLLDIGGGIGAIQWGFLENGGAKTTDVDSSSGYIQIASSYAKDKGYDHSYFIIADVKDVTHELENHDFVTLDKVVCCYPDYEQLLEIATNKTNHVLAMTLPMGGLVSRFLSKLSALYFLIKKNPFRTFIHDPKKVQAFIEAKGFQLKTKKIRLPWLIRVYERTHPL